MRLVSGGTFPLVLTFIISFRSRALKCPKQNNHGGGKNGKFVIDIDDDEDDFGFSSGDEGEISEDQRIMDEMIQRERDHMVRNAQRLRRSQTEENTLINSGDKLFDPNY